MKGCKDHSVKPQRGCMKCAKAFYETSRSSDCSAWVVSKVISQPFDTKEEAESFAETMKEGFTHKNDALLVTQNDQETPSRSKPNPAAEFDPPPLN